MRVITLSAKSPSIKKLAVNDIREITDVCFCGRVYKNGIENAKELVGKNTFLPLGVMAVKTYNLNGRIFVYSSDGKIREKTEEGFKVYTKNVYNTAPIMFSLYSKGKESVVIATERGSMVFDGKERKYVKNFSGEISCVYNGILFSADKNRLYFCDNYDYTDSVLESAKTGSIKIGNSFGEIVGLSSTNEGVNVFCEKGILFLDCKSSPEYFSLTEKTVITGRIKKGTVKKIGKGVYFADQEGISIFDGEIKRVFNFGKNVSLVKNAFSGEDYYVLCVICDGQNRLVIYETENKCGYYVNSPDVIYADGVVGYNRITGQEYGVQKGNGGFIWKSKPITFSDPDKKRLKSIRYYSDADTEINVFGDFGKKGVNAKAGEVKQDFNLVSDRFIITLKSSVNCKITDITFYYTEE